MAVFHRSTFQQMEVFILSLAASHFCNWIKPQYLRWKTINKAILLHSILYSALCLLGMLPQSILSSHLFAQRFNKTKQNQAHKTYHIKSHETKKPQLANDGVEKSKGVLTKLYLLDFCWSLGNTAFCKNWSAFANTKSSQSYQQWLRCLCFYWSKIGRKCPERSEMLSCKYHWFKNRTLSQTLKRRQAGKLLTRPYCGFIINSFYPFQKTHI